MPELELALADLGTHLEWPTTPDLAPAVRTQIAGRPAARGFRPRPALVLAFAVLAVAVAAILAVPQTRAAILEFFHLRGVTIERVQTLPTVTENPGLGLLLGDGVTLDQVGTPVFSEEDPTTNGRILVVSNTDTMVYDVSDKTAPKLIGTLPGVDQHTMQCVLDCTWVYGSEGAIIDLRDPTKPKLIEKSWRDDNGVEVTSTHDVTEVSPTPRSTARILRDGFMVGVSNPKSMVFLAAVLPQFVDHDGGSIPVQMVLLGLIFVGVAFSTDSTYAWAAGTARNWFGRSPRRLSTMQGSGGLMMIGLGGTLALTGQK